MRAPARGISNGVLLPFHDTDADGRRKYRQIDDELLDALQLDVASGEVKMGHTIGMMIARIREAERDRDAFDVECTRRAADMHDLREQNGIAFAAMGRDLDHARAEFQIEKQHHVVLRRAVRKLVEHEGGFAWVMLDKDEELAVDAVMNSKQETTE